MKKVITIKSMSLLNFKGARKLSVNFDQQTDIYGANATGKTTLFDAFVWCLFGKDSTDRKDFEIKTIDVTGKVIEKVEHEVEVLLMVDSDEVKLKRIYREKWTTKRGSSEPEFTGHETTFFWNDVPKIQSEYNKKVSDILDETVFKMITSPTFFNETMKWQDRKNVLLQIAGEVTDEQVAGDNPNYLTILGQLTQGKTLEQYKAQIAASVKKAKDELKMIPTRIDEAERGRPEAVDYKSVEKEISTKQTELTEVENQIQDKNSALDAAIEKNKVAKINVANIEAKITGFENQAKSEALKSTKPDDSALTALVNNKTTAETNLNSYKSGLSSLEQSIEFKKSRKSDLENNMAALRKQWETENAKSFTMDSDGCCPTCKQQLPASELESQKSELLKNFNENKNQKLNEINASGAKMKAEVEVLTTEIDALQKRIDTGKEAVESAEKAYKEAVEALDFFNANNSQQNVDVDIESIVSGILSKNEEYQKLLLEFDVEKSMIQDMPQVDTEALKQSQATLKSEIDALKAKLSTKAINEQIDNRIAELKNQEKEFVTQIADVEKTMFDIENFEKDKILMNEQLVNSKFKLVQFRMFEEQINGGYTPTCVATLNGVPFADINNASKINAGLDIINTLCELYGVTAPIFIDNAESVHTLIDTDSQLIRLVVSEFHKQLEVKSKELAA